MRKMFCLTIMLIGVLLVGCSQRSETTDSSAAPATGSGNEQAQAGDHSGWWCTEHGVPEEECSLCSTEAAAKFKEKGDWCAEHGRAESQCFKCDPSRAEKFAKLYEAKLGKKPPAPTE